MKEKIIIDGVDVSGCKNFISTYTEDEDIEINNCCTLTYTPCQFEKKNCYYKQLKQLKQENESLYEEKNCLHKIIDRLLENGGYSKDIASAEDFEDVYEDMQIKRNKLIELEQENERLKEELASFMSGDYCAESCKKMNNAFQDVHKAILKENEELKEEYQQAHEDFICSDTCLRIANTEKDELKHALEEIMEILAKPCICVEAYILKKIQNIITEAIGE